MYFCIVARGDVPIFELDLSELIGERAQPREMSQLAAHAALDDVDQRVWQSTQMYLKEVDRFNDKTVSAFVTAGHLRLMLIHSRVPENVVRHFFQEVHACVVAVVASPFTDRTAPLKNDGLRAKVSILAHKFFRSR